MITIIDNLTPWLKGARARVKGGVLRSATESIKIIHSTSEPRVPIDLGYLRKSFRSAIFDENERVVVEVGYSVLDNPNSPGEDYAFHQHEVFYVHPKGGRMHYLSSTMADEEQNIKKLIETDYLTSLNSS